MTPATIAAGLSESQALAFANAAMFLDACAGEGLGVDVGSVTLFADDVLTAMFDAFGIEFTWESFSDLVFMLRGQATPAKLPQSDKVDN